jgi:hypothetical protein
MPGIPTFVAFDSPKLRGSAKILIAYISMVYERAGK